MKQQYTLLLSTLVALLLPAMQAWASLSDYKFQVQLGSYMDIRGTELISGYDYEGWGDRVSEVTDIGFTFYFDGIPYNSFSVAENGLIGFGPNPVSGCWENQLATEDGLCGGYADDYDYTLFQTPHLAAFWDELWINEGGAISYTVLGAAPNRILVIDFSNVNTDYIFGEASSYWQVRLYEGSNKIEYYYDYMSYDYWQSYYLGEGGTIGMAASGSNLLSVSANIDYDAETIYYSVGTKPDDYFSLLDPEAYGYSMIPSGAMLSFTPPCNIQATAATQKGDTLLKGEEMILGGSATFTPVTLSLNGSCESLSYTLKITGANAGDYQISPTSGTFLNGGKPVKPVITFTPTGAGQRNATLTVTDQSNRSVSFQLAATGLSRIVYTPNLAQGGSPNLANGDTLLASIRVRRNQSGTFTPFTLTNISSNTSFPAAAVTFAITGASGGQYSIAPGSASLAAGQSSTPVITFAPTGVGRIVDTLVVTTEGQSRKFVLLGFGDAIGAQFFVNDKPFGSGAPLFAGTSTCIGEGGTDLAIDVQNIGTGPFDVTGLDVYAIDTTRMNQPPYALQRDENGQLVRMTDYVITDVPYVPGATVSYPVIIPEGKTQRLYLTFVGSQSGRRFARVFINTNGENFSDLNAEGMQTPGLLSVDVYGTGIGARIAGSTDGSMPKPLVFGPTELGETRQLALPIYNGGQCTLRIDNQKLRIFSGDVDQFRIVDLPTSEIVVGPGESTSIMVSFTPNQVGSRRATIALATNDMSLGQPDNSVSGVLYVDLYGVGGSGLYTESPEFAPTVIGGTAADYTHGVVRVINNANLSAPITAIEIIGDDAADFLATGTWPTLPTKVNPGQTLELPVTFAPMGGTSGIRNAQLRIVTTDGAELLAPLSGFAGTRVLTVDRPVMNFIGTTRRGTRQTLTITNTGTIALKMNAPVLAGSEGSGFALGSLPRLELAPGQSEQLEISYAPAAVGASNATLTLTSNAPGAGSLVTVQLNGQAQQSIGGWDDDQQTTMPGDRYNDNGATPGDLLQLSGVDGEVVIGGLALRQSVPNPGRDVVSISYVLSARSEVRLDLYDGVGRLLRVLDAGVRESGEHGVSVEVHDLPSGVYHYRLSAGGKVLDRSLRVVR